MGLFLIDKKPKRMLDTITLNEKLLVKELMVGNEKAFRKLFDAYRNDVYAYSVSLIKTSALAETAYVFKIERLGSFNK